MKIIVNGTKNRGFVLADIDVGEQVFRFPLPREYDSEDPLDLQVEPHIRIDATQLGVQKRGKKEYREFNVRDWLRDRAFIAVCSLRTGVITVHSEETIVMPLEATLEVVED